MTKKELNYFSDPHLEYFCCHYWSGQVWLYTYVQSGHHKGYQISKLVTLRVSAPAFSLAKFTVYRGPSWVYVPSIQFSRSVVSPWTLWPHGLQHSRSPSPSLTPRVYSNSCLLSQWYHPTISSFVVPFSSRFQSFQASGSFLMEWLLASGDQSSGASASASVIPMNIQGWFPLGLTGLISLMSKGLSRVFSSTFWRHQFFGTQLTHDYRKNHSFDYMDFVVAK